MKEIVLHLDDEEFAALAKIAFSKNRPIQDQLNHILRNGFGLGSKTMRELSEVVQILISESDSNEPPMLVTFPIEDYELHIKPLNDRFIESGKNEFDVKPPEYGVTTVVIVSEPDELHEDHGNNPDK